MEFNPSAQAIFRQGDILIGLGNLEQIERLNTQVDDARAYARAKEAEAVGGPRYNRDTRLEGILPALESSHAIAHLRKLAPELGPDALIVVNLSGRGDKDAPLVREILQERRGTA